MSLPTSPRILIIGAGSRGHAYAQGIRDYTPGRIVGVAEPAPWKRNDFARRYSIPSDGLIFSDWETAVASGRLEDELDGVCVCTRDETHADVVTALRPLNLHILCEKPLSTTLESCRDILRTVRSGGGKEIVFAVGHVLRYSPHNILLHRLVTQEKVIGEVVNINHTEPVGNWHFAHSYVRGNWRSSQDTAPSLLTKCCHDIDLLLWLTSPQPPARVSSHGSLVHFKKSHKPPKADSATNCFQCPLKDDGCAYSAKRIYIDNQLKRGMNTGWPNKIVCPEIEDAPNLATAEALLTEALGRDYNADAGKEEGEYYGRCVYESSNDVVDNQTVVLEWDDSVTTGLGAKTATLTMIAHTKRICQRITKIYGTRGEISADSSSIIVYDFETQTERLHRPEQIMKDVQGHGSADRGLAVSWIAAIKDVLNGASVQDAQEKHVRCTPEDAVRSHEVVFWAEEARRSRRVVEWSELAEMV